MSLALARKYRPRNFASVAVQSHVANTLKGAIARGRVAHGYLLCGPRGTGKTTLARVLAMALNCERRGDPELAGEPCGHCQSCTRIWSGSTSLDVIEIDAASNRGVDDARELRERAMYAPSTDDGYKVYIVDEAHMLTREAWNALLKVLEEPPPRVVFVFATTDPQKIVQAANPVMSRLQRFDLKRIGPAEIRERLAMVLHEEGIAFEDDALGMIARAADGGLRDALSLADQVLSLDDTGAVTAERVRAALGLVPEEEYLALFDLVIERRAADIFGAVQRLADAGVDFALVLSGLGDLLRALLAIVLGGAPTETSERMKAALTQRKAQVAASDLLRMLHALLEMEPMFRKSGQPQLLVETLLVRFALLDRTVELEEVLRGFGAGDTTDPPVRRVSASDARVAPAYALSPGSGSMLSPATATRSAATPASTVASDSAPARAHGSVTAGTGISQGGAMATATAEIPEPRPATQQVARAAAAVQEAAAHAPPNGAHHAPAPAPHREGIAPPTIESLKARWSEVSDEVRRTGRGMLAQAVQRIAPQQVAAAGGVLLGYSPADDTFARAVEAARADVLTAIQSAFPGVTAFTLRVISESPAASKRASKRLTAEDVQKERVEQLSSRDPLLDAAVRVLDLELLD